MISTYPHEQLGCFPRQAAEMGHTCMVDDSSATLGKRWGSSLIRNKKSPIHCDCHSIFVWYITFYIFVYIYICWYGMVWYGMVCIFWADAHRRLRWNTRPSISSQCGLESYWMRTCFRNIFLRLFGTYLLEIDGFLGASEFPKAPVKGFS